MTIPATTPADGELLQRIADNDPSWVLKYLEQNTRFDVPRIRELFEFAKVQATAMLATPSPAQATPADGQSMAITVWKDGRWKMWSEADARYACNDPDWLTHIPLATSPGKAEATAKQRYDEFMREGEEPSPIERLRFFCSLAMDGQDWLDVEPFFDAIQ